MASHHICFVYYFFAWSSVRWFMLYCYNTLRPVLSQRVPPCLPPVESTAIVPQPAPLSAACRAPQHSVTPLTVSSCQLMNLATTKWSRHLAQTFLSLLRRRWSLARNQANMQVHENTLEYGTLMCFINLSQMFIGIFLFLNILFCGYNNNNGFTVLCPGLHRWAVTRRDIHPLTPIMFINHPLSASSNYCNPWHLSWSVYILDSLFV